MFGEFTECGAGSAERTHDLLDVVIFEQFTIDPGESLAGDHQAGQPVEHGPSGLSSNINGLAANNAVVHTARQALAKVLEGA